MSTPTLSPSRALADVSRGRVVATVEIGVPPERVFRALASEELVNWWGSADTYRVVKWSGDLRVGGAWRSDGVGADGQPFSVGGEFIEVDPPRRLVMTWIAPWDGNQTTTVTYALERVAAGTRLSLTHDGFGDRAASCENHAAGWDRVLGHLLAYLAASRRPDAPSR